VVTVDDNVVRIVKAEEYFGELALTDKDERTATVTSSSDKPLLVAAVDVAGFERVLGPLKSIQQRLHEKREAYKFV